MVITEEKILSNIDKVQKLINPNSKKQIVQLEDDSYFKDLVESIKTYLIEYPKKKNFPKSVYKEAYNLVEYATNQFEENTKKIEDLIRKREKNIKLASLLRDVENTIKAKAKNWREIVKKLATKYPEDVVEALTIIGESEDKESEEYQSACKLIDSKINNLETNLHIEIDMERIEDRSKALTYIGLEIAEALKYIPAPIDEIGLEEEIQEKADDTLDKVEAKLQEIETPAETKVISNAKSLQKDEIPTIKEVQQAVEKEEIKPTVKSSIIQEAVKEEVQPKVQEKIQDKTQEKVQPKVQAIVKEEAKEEINEDVAIKIDEKEQEEFLAETRFEEKPSLWQKIKNCKIVRAIRFVMKIKIVLEYPALPEGRGE
jgi:hypothetical protein